MGRTDEPISIPSRYPTAAIFIDESGSRATASNAFVVAAIKVREPGKLLRAVKDVRDKTGFTSEFKFSEITRNVIPVYTEVIRALHESDATVAATVVHGSVYNPFQEKGREVWEVHAQVTEQLLVGCINRRELVGVHLDTISTPTGTSFEDTIRRGVNRRLRSTSVVSAVTLDSRTTDLLQVADVVAGSILHARRLAAGKPPKTISNKAKVSAHFGNMFGRPDLSDGRDARLNIRTYKGARQQTSRSSKISVLRIPPVAG